MFDPKQSQVRADSRVFESVIRTAIYQIFVDRFAGPNGEQLQPPPEGADPWRHHCGGTLDGITARLDHIQQLGADAIYLTPVFRATSNHKYDAASYDEVDPRFGGDAAFERLAAECQARGLGLILDGVFNHVGSDHEWFVEAQSDNGHSPRRNHFKWCEETGQYACWRGHGSLPELELACADVQKALFAGESSVIRKWLRRGATGWRLDCANDLGLEHCSQAVGAARLESPMDGVVGEVMTYAEDWVREGQLDGVMNYYFRETVLGLVRGDIPVAQAAYNFKRMARRYRWRALIRSWNMLASHDTPRLATMVPDMARRHLALVLQFVFPGIPMLYYGEPVGMEGGHDPDCRRPMIWDESQWHQPTYDLVKRLIALRHGREALMTGDYLPMPQPGAPSVLSFARATKHPAELVLVIANASDEPFEGKLFLPYSYLFDGLELRDLLGREEPVWVSAGSIKARLAPWSVALYSPYDAHPRYSFFRG